MWVLILITVTGLSGTAPNIVSVDGFKTQASCISAVQFSKKRNLVHDAYCVSKQ